MVVDYRIHENTDTGVQRTFASIVEYEVSGNKYRLVRTTASVSKQKLGKKIKVMYDPKNPTDAIQKHDYTVFIFIVIGIIFLIMGISALDQYIINIMNTIRNS